VLEPGFLVSCAVLGGLFLAGLLVYLRGRGAAALLFSFGVFWFFIALSVESSIVPLAFIFEHRMYLPVAGLCMAAASGFYLLLGMAGRHVSRPALVAVVFLVPAMFMVLTYERNGVWESRASLWEDVLRKSPRNPRAHNNLGAAYAKAGRLDEAKHRYIAALALAPGHSGTLNNLGQIYSSSNMFLVAETVFMMAIASDPENADAYYNLGVIYENQGRADEAVKYYSLSIARNPQMNIASHNLATLLMREDRDQAIASPFSDLLVHPPGDAEAHVDYGMANYRIGEHDLSVDLLREALVGEHDLSVDLLREALEIEPDSAEAHYSLGIVYGELGRIDEALEHYWEAIRCDPDFRSAHYNMATLLLMAGRTREAVEHFRAVIEFKPRDLNAHVNIATAYHMLGDVDMSIRHLRKALDIAPDDMEVHYNLGLALRAKGLDDEADRHFAIAERLGLEVEDKPGE
jgi:tetratricopeptide (TPR) repeat protein